MSKSAAITGRLERLATNKKSPVARKPPRMWTVRMRNFAVDATTRVSRIPLLMADLIESSRRGGGQTSYKPGIAVPKELYERTRAAAYALGTLPSHIVVTALEMAVSRLEEIHGPFPPGPGRLPKGRPTDAQRRAAGLLP